jgi:hypothetical protein
MLTVGKSGRQNRNSRIAGCAKTFWQGFSDVTPSEVESLP